MTVFTLPSFSNFIGIATKLILFLLGCVTISFVLWCLTSGFFRDLRASIQSIKGMSKKTEFLMRAIVPTLIRPLETHDAKLQGLESRFIDIVLSDEYTTMKSPKELNGKGNYLLNDSKVFKIVDENLEPLIQKLESQQLKTLFDVQQRSLCSLRRLESEDEESFAHIKNYLYSHPDKCLNEILYVGSLYLRNKYRDTHKELSEELEHVL